MSSTAAVIGFIILAIMNIAVLAVMALRKGVSARERERLLDEVRRSADRVENGVREEFRRSREESGAAGRTMREELSAAFKNLGDSMVKTLGEMSQMQKNQLDSFSGQLNAMTRSNEQNLEKIRVTVDEKLNKTLEERLGRSFKMVSESLEQVQKGLGEMQALAAGVGDLKKVLSNVKTRGILGEMQLGAILEQLLTREQYDTNVATRKGSRDNVEFAIRLPGREGQEQVVWLPVDSKFPLEVYHSLSDAYERGEGIEAAGKELENAIRRCAKDIRDKYIDPPQTTDFAVMFLPVEGLYAEVVRRAGLLEVLQRDYRIVVTGPSTLAALLNSLQMGFRTLAIEKRSSEVWRVLGAVKTEFEKFSVILKKAQDRLVQVHDDIDRLVGARTRQIQKQLRNIQQLPAAESALMIGEEPDGAGEEEEETEQE